MDRGGSNIFCDQVEEEEEEEVVVVVVVVEMTREVIGKGFCENRPESDLVPVEIGPDDVQAVVLDHVSILPLPTGEDAKSGMEGAAEVEDGEKTSEDKKHAVAAPSSALAASYLLRFADEAGRMDLDKALALGRLCRARALLRFQQECRKVLCSESSKRDM
eukprot:764055-Hanusia_phi.AAC.1